MLYWEEYGGAAGGGGGGRDRLRDWAGFFRKMYWKSLYGMVSRELGGRVGGDVDTLSRGLEKNGKAKLDDVEDDDGAAADLVLIDHLIDTRGTKQMRKRNKYFMEI